MDHIFISYSRKDELQVSSFVEELRKSGFEIWQDVSGKRSGIPYSVKWFEVIEEAIITAAGAIIFNTEAWTQSSPCQDEFQLIQDAAIPFIYLSVNRLLDERQLVFNESAAWCRKQIFSAENGYCKWMRSGAYRTYKNLPVESYFPMGKHPIQNWMWIRKCYDLSGIKNFNGPWVEGLVPFLAKAKKKFVFNIAIKIFLGIVFFSILVWVLSAREAIQTAKDTNQLLSTKSAVLNEVKRVSAHDPVRAIQMLEKCGTVITGYDKNAYSNDAGVYIPLNQENRMEYLGASNFYLMSNRILADLVSRNYPVAFYESPAECPENISNMSGNRTSSQYTVTLSKDTSQVFIYDKAQNITRQLLLAAVPETYCFSENGHRLIIAAANTVYIYDLRGETQPILLSYNFEDIKDLFTYKNKIYAVTQKNHVVIWNTPLQERKITDSKVLAGCLTQLEDGRVIAVYVSDGSLTINIDNEEKRYLLPLEGIIDEENIALSPDYTYAAVSYRPNGSQSDRIGVVALSNGEIQKIYDTESSIVGFIFSMDGTSIITTCYFENGIERINLKTGEIQKSDDETYSNPYSLIEYDGQFLVSDIAGRLTVYDNSLSQIGDYRLIGCAAPQKQLAVSPNYNCLLTAGRVGMSLPAIC